MAAGRKDCALLAALLLLRCGILYADTTVTVKEGEDAELGCNYGSSLQNPRTEWKFTDAEGSTSLLYYDGQLTEPYKGRVIVFPQGVRLNKASRSDRGDYTCEVTGKNANGAPDYKEFKTHLMVLVPPSVPTARVPSSVSTGSTTVFHCVESDASPPPTFTWYKNGVPMPENPKSSPTFQNTSYTLDSTTGQLKLSQAQKTDIGDYYCVATNSQGTQKSAVVRMDVQDVNVGGIVAAVIVSLIILLLIAFGVWFAYRRGYIGKKSTQKVIYSQPSETRSDKNFQQTSSFLV